MSGFVWLENHSVYSLMEGTIFISELVSIARKRGYKYLSLTDTNGFYGLVNFIQACREAGINPIIGAKIESPSFNGILIAKNTRGYSQISEIITELHLERNENNNVLLEAILETETQDYIVITTNRKLLSFRKKNVYAEINVLKKNYALDYFNAKKLGIKPVLIHPIYFLSAEDYHVHKLLRAIHLNKKIYSLDREDTEDERAYFKDDSYIFRTFGFMLDAIKNTEEIAKECTFNFEMGNPIMPTYSVNSFRLLKSLCYRNIPKRYKEINRELIQRLEKELAIIKDKGFSDYFLIVHDIVKRSIYTCGRGSAASSLVSYLLFITHVDPLKHNLFFERFLNRARTDPPDIDLDFPWDERDKILKYIFKKYSSEHVAMVSNHITFEARSALREVAKVYGIPEQEIKQVTKHIRHYYNRTSDDFLNFSENKSPSLQIYSIIKDVPLIYGRPRYLSVHAGGIIITPKKISSYVPVQMAPKGIPIIQFEKDQAEDFGLVKIDILGNRSLAVIRDTLKLIKKQHGINIDYHNFNPLNDEKTVQMLARGNTIGVFYVESPAMRQLQKKTGKGDYEHLVIHSSIIRPAANPYIKEYIERLKGKPYTPILPEMDYILRDSYGIMCYQEDITRIAMQIADFDIKEGQELRKVISKKNKIKRKLELKEKFYFNLLNKGIETKKIDEIWNMIESFSGYSFCKAHSASYALVSFKACYLKAHYPAEFLGAVLKNQGGYYSALAYISESRRMGIKIVMPDINKSRYFHYGNKDKIYIGFMIIKGLSHTLGLSIESQRAENGPFKGLADFITRLKPSRSDTIRLIKAGCFNSIENYNVPQLLYMANRIFESNNEEIGPLFTHLSNWGQENIKNGIPNLNDLSEEQKLSNEINSFGFILSEHPMKYYRKILQEKVIKAIEIPKFIGKQVKVCGILVTAKTVLTKNETLMQFVSFEDETDIFESVLFPQIYKRFSLILEEEMPYILEGKVVQEFGVTSLEVYNIKKLDIKNLFKEETQAYPIY